MRAAHLKAMKTALISAVFLCMGVAQGQVGTAGSDAVANPGDARLDAIMSEYWDFSLQEDPIAASGAGLKIGNDRLPAVTPADVKRRQQILERYRGRVQDIRPSSLSANGRVNAELFEWVLDDAIDAIELRLDRIPFNTFSGFYMGALHASDGLRMESASDYESYIKRMRDIPRYFAENMANMQAGSNQNFVLPRIVIDGVLPTIRAQVKDAPEDSSFYEPFREMSSRVDEAAQQRLRAEAREVIAGHVMPAFARLAKFLDTEYEASSTLGAEQLAGGEDYYQFQIRRYTTLVDKTSEQIHQIGLQEVRRIRGEMDRIIAELNFDGDFRQFAEFLRTDPQFYAKTAEELLQVAASTAKRIDYRMPGYFGLLPRQPYGIVPVPDEIAPNYTTGAYYGAPLNSDHGGALWINTYALDQRPLYELPALILHEGVPGHHHQNAIGLEMRDVPEFRKNLYFSAFGEGWALYTEKLGVEMGIYQTPYEHFGRLSYEMWRACRLVIDTGIHAKGWSRQQAIDFMSDNTSLSEGNIRAEIDRYISWPGQALAYKLGELKIWELREKSERLLGERFDLRSFHDLLLRNGALPMAMLESVVERYIDETLQQQ